MYERRGLDPIRREFGQHESELKYVGVEEGSSHNGCHVDWGKSGPIYPAANLNQLITE